jgi:HAD superfamily hydrolase (TIGR01509 family)
VIRALVFDYDGLIADTEAPEFQAWSEVWSAHGHELTLHEWSAAIGTVDGFDPLHELGARVGPSFDRDAANDRRRTRHRELMEGLAPLPGVVELLRAAHAAGLKTAVASSSPPWWVQQGLEGFGLVDAFAAVRAYDGTRPAKPAPDLYLAACDAVGVAPRDAVAFEDSPNGIAAAKAAGLWCVAVPHDLTRHLDLSAADVVVDSLAEVTLEDLQLRFGG